MDAVTQQLSLSPGDVAPAPDPVPSRERVLRMAAATMYLEHGGCWTRPLPELVEEARRLVARMLERPPSASNSVAASDMRDAQAWLAEAEAWIAGGGR